MRPKFWIIAKNTFREIIRDRVLYGLLVFSLLLIGLSSVLGDLSYAEQTRISLNFGLAGIHFSSVILAIFVGSSLVSKELEKQTILTLLVRPVSRTTFLWGKFLGLTLINLLVTSILSLVLVIVLFILGKSPHLSLLVCLHGFVMESVVLLALTMLFGVITKSTLAVVFSMGVFLIGHWIRDLEYFAERSTSSSFKMFAEVVRFFIPDLEQLNWKSSAIYEDPVPFVEVLRASGYALGWVLILVMISSFLFRRKDFV